MAKPALVIDMLSAPSAEEEREAGASGDSDALGASTKADPEAIIADLRSQLDQLEAIVGGLR